MLGGGLIGGRHIDVGALERHSALEDVFLLSLSSLVTHRTFVLVLHYVPLFLSQEISGVVAKLDGRLLVRVQPGHRILPCPKC